MTSEEEPTVQAAMDPLDDLVLAVRGDQDGESPDYELPPSVTLDQASEILGLTTEDSRRMQKDGTFPVPVIPIGSTRRVGTAPLIRTVGLTRVRKALRYRG
ncbi:hypothetical protein ABZ419_09810 [Streptomyces cinnamoneus]|uniref:hypothetical protein n=1 Tax=Streptomyces cinnamoneus TaxID=53446 RepID=UPI0033FB3E3D